MGSLFYLKKGLFLTLLVTLQIQQGSQEASEKQDDTLKGPRTGEWEVPVAGSLLSRAHAAEFDRTQLTRGHARVRRAAAAASSTPSEHHHVLRLDVTALNTTFRLRLVPDAGLFAADVVFEGSQGQPLSFDPGRAYHGTLEDDPSARVQGVVTTEGLFDGSILYPSGEAVFIEPATRYQLKSSEGNLHSLAYRARDVRPPIQLHECASQSLHQKTQGSLRPRRWRRERRAALGVDPGKTTCMLYLQADHLFHNKFGSEEACIEVMTRHVQRVNAIYQGTDFDQDGRTDTISFMIKRLKVHTTEALNETGYRFPGNYGVEKFLELFSEEDYDAFCLAYMFTYRDFEMGTLGLAWTGDLKNAGGVCEKNGHYRGSMKSLNTGIVTLLNYGKHVPPAVSHVTLAHEIGHNFGSPHDPETCTPGGEDGNFIMFARATSGDKRNNNKFSPCSLQAISPVLANKARGPRGCFTEPQAAICGNGVVESGEECDCGWEEDCRDACCFPMSSSPRPGESPCRLTPRSACSPSQGPCCTGECHLKFGDKCRDDNGCRDASFCDGRGPACPPSTNKPNKTVCNEEFVCFMGECTGSICLAYGLESCQCVAGPRDPPTKACELCCKEPGDDKPCMSSFDWNLPPFDIPDLYSKPGTPCNNYNGYCDVFQKCREVDPSGPLATLRKLLLSDESLASVRRWVTQHWYAVLLAAGVIAAIMVTAARLLGRGEDSKLRTVTVLHPPATQEPVRLPATGQGGLTVHPAIRSRLPLGKRVRAKVSKKAKAAAQEEDTAAAAAVKSSPAKSSPTKTSPAKSSAAAADKSRVTKHKNKKRRRRNKEVIDYSTKPTTSGAQASPGDGGKGASSSPPLVGTCAASEDPLGKVRNWLLSSGMSGITAPSRATQLPKSKSSPAGLHGESAPKKPGSLGAGSLLQARAARLLCKPPFKLQVKLKRPSNTTATTSQQPTSGGRRAALLIRSTEASSRPTTRDASKTGGKSGKRGNTSRGDSGAASRPPEDVSDKAVLLPGGSTALC